MKKLLNLKINYLEGKRVLVRVDFNVPVKKGEVLDNSRILASIPTIDFLREHGAKIILMAHLGRPKGKVLKKYSLDPVRAELEKLFGSKVKKIESENWHFSPKKKDEIIGLTKKIRKGGVAIFDNLRFTSKEQKNTEDFAELLSEFADIFVLDGFGVSHRESASVTGITGFLPSFAGLLLEKEIKKLSTIFIHKKKGLDLFLGGIKVSSKLPVVEHFLPKAQNIFIGGGMFNTYLKALGYGIGDSIFDAKDLELAKKLLKKRQVIKPVDVIVGTLDGKNYRCEEIKKTKHLVAKKGEYILDIGPKSIKMFLEKIASADMIVWNGAFGYFEVPPYDYGTKFLIEAFVSKGKTKKQIIAGGGETAELIHKMKKESGFSFISTGGGAMLEFLAKESLDSLKNLNGKKFKK